MRTMHLLIGSTLAFHHCSFCLDQIGQYSITGIRLRHLCFVSSRSQTVFPSAIQTSKGAVYDSTMSAMIHRRRRSVGCSAITPLADRGDRKSRFLGQISIDGGSVQSAKESQRGDRRPSKCYQRANVMEKQRGRSRGLNNLRDILSSSTLPNLGLVVPPYRFRQFT